MTGRRTWTGSGVAAGWRGWALVGVVGAAAFAAGGCPGGDAKNPTRVYLAPNGGELFEKLQPEEPPPF